MRQSTPALFCAACGFAFETAIPTTESGSNQAARFPTPRSAPRPLRTDSDKTGLPILQFPSRNFDVMEYFGWRSVAGTVIAVEAPYMTKPETNSLWLLPRLVIGIFLLPFILAALIAGFIVSGMWSLFFSFGSRGDRPGFVSHLASQLLGYYLTGKLFGPKEMVPVRDIRVRDASACEHLVRIRGELSAGNVAVGDEIEVSGFNRHGTLMFQRGVNRRTRAAILVRRQ